MSGIQIVVTGQAGQGKTAISQLIKRALACHDIPVDIIDQDGDKGRNLGRRLAAIRDAGTKVLITQESAQYSLFSTENTKDMKVEVIDE